MLVFNVKPFITSLVTYLKQLSTTASNASSKADTAIAKHGQLDSELSELKLLVNQLQARVASLSELAHYSEYDSRRFTRAVDFAGKQLTNNVLIFIPFTKPFSRRPDVCVVTLDISTDTPRNHYVNKVTKDGFWVSCNYIADLQGGSYIAGIKRENA